MKILLHKSNTVCDIINITFILYFGSPIKCCVYPGRLNGTYSKDPTYFIMQKILTHDCTTPRSRHVLGLSDVMCSPWEFVCVSHKLAYIRSFFRSAENRVYRCVYCAKVEYYGDKTNRRVGLFRYTRGGRLGRSEKQIFRRCVG